MILPIFKALGIGFCHKAGDDRHNQKGDNQGLDHPKNHPKDSPLDFFAKEGSCDKYPGKKAHDQNNDNIK